MLNIVILNDNSFDSDYLYNIINNWAYKMNYIVTVDLLKNGKELTNSKNIISCDLLFCDITLKPFDSICSGECNGINICQCLRQVGFVGDIIFFSSSNKYAFESYRVHALFYLLKPLSEAEIIKCLDYYIKLHYPKFYYYHKDNTTIRIPYNDIISVSKLNHDCIIQTSVMSFSERTSLRKMSYVLPTQFLRCHKSCIVNIYHIVSLSGNILKLSNNKTQRIGQLYINNIRSELNKLSKSKLFNN